MIFDKGFDIEAQAILKAGCEKFGLPQGIISHICHDIYEIMAIYPEHEMIRVGDNLALEDTYCREVVVTEQVVAITEMDGVPGMQNHPLYSNMPLEAYISAPIFVKSDIWGTLNFSALSIRHVAFGTDDIEWMKSQATNIENLILATETKGDTL